MASVFHAEILHFVCSPETQAYLQKLEREKQEKVQGEQGDNRSFLAKYVSFFE